MYFTQDDFKKIHEWLKRNSVKDSEFPLATSENGTEYITMVQNGKNVILPFNTFKSMVGGVVNVIAPPTITSENNMITINASPANKIYYTISKAGEEYYPELDEEGKPLDTSTTYSYSGPIDYTEDVIVRAIVVYTNAEGKVLISEVAEYEAKYEVTLLPPVISFSNDENNTVTITNPNDKGTIYYTINGDTPTDNSTILNAPFTFKITENCIVKAVIIEGRNTSEITISGELIFHKRTIRVPQPVSKTYNGATQTSYEDTEDYTVSGDVSGINADKYTVTFTLRDSNNTKWETTDERTVKVTWQINKKELNTTLSITPSKSSYEVGDTITFNASVNGGESISGNFTYHRGTASGTAFESSEYTLQDTDKDNLTIVAVYNLDKNYTNNYSVKNSSKTITVAEKSIPWQYATIQSATMGDIIKKIEGYEGADKYNHVKISDFEGITEVEFKPLESAPNPLSVSKDTPFLILAYPKNSNEEVIVTDTQDGVYEYGKGVWMGHNIEGDTTIKIYFFNGGSECKLIKQKK